MASLDAIPESVVPRSVMARPLTPAQAVAVMGPALRRELAEVYRGKARLCDSLAAIERRFGHDEVWAQELERSAVGWDDAALALELTLPDPSELHARCPACGGGGGPADLCDYHIADHGA